MTFFWNSTRLFRHSMHEEKRVFHTELDQEGPIMDLANALFALVVIVIGFVGLGIAYWAEKCSTEEFNLFCLLE
jgi:hypothetical protein